MNLKEAIKPFTDQYGLVHPNGSAESLNGLSYTAEYYVLLKLRGELTSQDMERYETTVKLLKTNDTWNLHRFPGNKDQQAWDDYANTLAACSALGNPIWGYELSHTIYNQFFYMNNEIYMREGATQFRHPDGRWNVSAFIGRFPQIHFVTALAAGKKPNALVQLLWTIRVLNTLNKLRKGTSSADGSRITWMEIVAYKLNQRFKSRLCDWVVSRWNNYFQTTGRTLADTQGDYFRDNHPFNEAFKEQGVV